MKLSIIIPCYNEENTIEKIIDKVLEATKDIDKELIVVYDFSKDKTRSIIENNLIHKIDAVVLNSKNYGKGYSLREGFKKASGDILLYRMLI